MGWYPNCTHLGGIWGCGDDGDQGELLQDDRELVYHMVERGLDSMETREDWAGLDSMETMEDLLRWN